MLTEGVGPHHRVRERKFNVLKVLHSSSLIGATKKLTMRRMSKEKDEIDEQTQTLPVGDERGEKVKTKYAQSWQHCIHMDKDFMLSMLYML